MTALLLPAPPASAATLTVTTTQDASGTCDAHCSVREAVLAANASAGPDTIEVPAGYYVLALSGTDDTSAAGDLDITSQLTLKAVGGVATIDAGTTLDRVLHVLATGDVRISGLTMTGGDAPSGGGILNEGTLSATNSTVGGNQVIPGGFGGGIYNSGTLSVTDSSVSGNQAPGGFGGGIYNTGDLTVTRSTVNGNDCDESGGGIFNTGTLNLTNGTLSGNDSESAGGGIFNSGAATVTRTTVSGNQSGTGGGGIFNNGTLTFTNGTVSGNDSPVGGGIRDSGTLTLTNSTLSGNLASFDGGGIYLDGASAQVDITNATITGNIADSEANGSGTGGGIRRLTGALTIANSILALNLNREPAMLNEPLDDCSGEITSADHNIISSLAGCTVAPMSNDDTGISPAMGPLAFNGGSTATHALPAGSAAVNHGPGAGAGSDQRGVPRKVGPAVDTGAYEQVFCLGMLVNVVGTAGNDVLSGTSNAEVVLAMAGNDLVRPGDGSDRVCAGPGADRVLGGAGNDVVIGESGRDRLLGGRGNDIISGGLGKDRLRGGIGNDNLSGGRGEDRLRGGPGDDNLSGGRGKDRLNGGPGNDTCSGGPGKDKLKRC